MLLVELASSLNQEIDTLLEIVESGVVDFKSDYARVNYSQEEVVLIRFSLQAIKLGFTLEEVKNIILLSRRGDSPCEEVRNMLAEKLEAAKNSVSESLLLYERLDKAIQLDSECTKSYGGEYTVCDIIQRWAETYNE